MLPAVLSVTVSLNVVAPDTVPPLKLVEDQVPSPRRKVVVLPGNLGANPAADVETAP